MIDEKKCNREVKQQREEVFKKTEKSKQNVNEKKKGTKTQLKEQRENDVKSADIARETAYVKTLLYMYPRLKVLAKNERELAQTRAVLSYDGRIPAEKLAYRVITCFYREEFLLELQKNLDSIVKEFNEEEKLILEYRFFRRKNKLKILCQGGLKISQRTFYRKQKSLPLKFAIKLKENGWNEDWFMENFSEDNVAMSIYHKILKGAEGGTCMPRKELQFSCRKSKESKFSECSQA